MSITVKEAQTEKPIAGQEVKVLESSRLHRSIKLRIGDLEIGVQKLSRGVAKDDFHINVNKMGDSGEVEWKASMYRKLRIYGSFAVDVFGSKGHILFDDIDIEGSEVRLKGVVGQGNIRLFINVGIDVDGRGYMSMEEVRRAHGVVESGRINSEDLVGTKRHLSNILEHEGKIRAAANIARQIEEIMSLPPVKELFKLEHPARELQKMSLH